MHIKAYIDSSSPNEYVEYIKELLEPFAVIKVRAMFGGFGVYGNNIMFALIVNNELYFKADTETAKFFQSVGSVPLSYHNRGKEIKLSYWLVLPEILDEPETMKIWFDKSFNVAVNSHFQKMLK